MGFNIAGGVRSEAGIDEDDDPQHENGGGEACYGPESGAVFPEANGADDQGRGRGKEEEDSCKEPEGRASAEARDADPAGQGEEPRRNGQQEADLSKFLRLHGDGLSDLRQDDNRDWPAVQVLQPVIGESIRCSELICDIRSILLFEPVEGRMRSRESRVEFWPQRPSWIESRTSSGHREEKAS